MLDKFLIILFGFCMYGAGYWANWSIAHDLINRDSIVIEDSIKERLGECVGKLEIAGFFSEMKEGDVQNGIAR